jgi:hypothetical protein
MVPTISLVFLLFFTFTSQRMDHYMGLLVFLENIIGPRRLVSQPWDSIWTYQQNPESENVYFYNIVYVRSNIIYGRSY